jgi:hypothetical protein
MPDTYKLQYDGMTLTYPGWNGCVSYEAQSFKTLTLLNSEGGSLTANTLTGYPGDTINLSTAYNTYWRFSGYQLTGDGSLVGNDYTFGTEDATICACFKPNAFTATGGFEKGSNVTITPTAANQTKSSSVRKYAIRNASTGDIPASWYSTSNRWNPSNASAYSITLNPKMTVTAKCGGAATLKFSAQFATLINDSYTNTAKYGGGGYDASKTMTYSKSSITSNVQSTYSISSYFRAFGGSYSYNTEYSVTSTYVATGTTGTWTATGYAP